jgi:hypothetical protein
MSVDEAETMRGRNLAASLFALLTFDRQGLVRTLYVAPSPRMAK